MSAFLLVESPSRARPLIFETRTERGLVVRAPDDKEVRDYASQVAQSVNGYLRARGERHLEASEFGSARSSCTACSDAISVRFWVNIAPRVV